MCLALCGLSAAYVGAQQSGKIANGFNLDEFPEVSFVYHSYNPDTLKASAFWHIKEAGSNRDFKVELQADSVGDIPQTTLILWEDMAHNGPGQFDFTGKVLTGFFEDLNISPTDKFAVSVFNRRKNTPATLIDLTPGFVNSKTEITEAIKSYKPSREHYDAFPNRSDLYSAIREGLDRLATEQGAKSIIVFTSGYSMKNSGADSESQVLLKAQQLHIPVHVFQYYEKSGVAPQAEGFAKSTFGTFNSYKYKDIPTAESDLKKLYPEIGKRSLGHNYNITFTSDAKHGDGARMISLSVDGDEVNEQLLPPRLTVSSWLKSHMLWVVLVAIVLVAGIVAVVLIIYKTKRKVATTRTELKALEQRRIQDKEDAEQSQRQMEENARLEREKHRRQAEDDRLLRLMEMKNLFPRLRYRVGSDIVTYEITKPVVNIGRDADNDVVLTDSKISRHHCKIVFNGYGFEIIDNQSTNKVIVNGRFIDRAVLKSGDIIGLGEDILTFNM